MKRIGYLLIAVGLALFVFVVYQFLLKESEIISPVPQKEGVTVEYITPGAEE